MTVELLQPSAIVESALVPLDVDTTAYPALVVMVGLPGSGKSYLSQRLARLLNAVVVESDRVRKLLFSEPDYGAEESALVHRVSRTVMRHLLKRGVRVISDATNLVEWQRETLYNLAERSGACIVVVRVTAPEAVIRERLEQRKSTPETLSDAGLDVYARMSRSEQAIRRAHVTVDTSMDIRVAERKIVKAVRNCERALQVPAG